MLTLHTTSGDIDLDDISAAGIETDTTSGDLELDEVDTQSLTFTSTSGDISRRADARGRIRRHAADCP